MNDDTPETILNQIAAILEEHTTVLKSHWENFEHLIKAILRTVFETEAETLILPLAFDLTEKAETRILPLVIENCPDYCKEVAQIKRRLEKLEAADSLDSSNAKFIADTTARLKAISTTLDAKA